MRKQKVYILNDEYQYINEKSFNYPSKMITIGNYTYIAGGSNLLRTDKDLNVLNYACGGDLYTFSTFYYDMYYNSTNNLIYVTAADSNSIQVFDLGLNVFDLIPTPE